jgi:MerR family transcriptional regulator, redox-sensitive transcriptional activator SoxR
MHGMSIGEVAEAAGLRPSAIRFYEQLGLLAEPPRVGGKRRYDRAVLERLAILRFAKHAGFKIAEIRLLLEGIDGRPPPERWRAMARQRLREVDAFLAEAATVKSLLRKTLRQRCPKLVERGEALAACPHAAKYRAIEMSRAKKSR